MRKFIQAVSACLVLLFASSAFAAGEWKVELNGTDLGDGRNCTEIRAGETCFLAFGPGTYTPGAGYTNWIYIKAGGADVCLNPDLGGTLTGGQIIEARRAVNDQTQTGAVPIPNATLPTAGGDYCYTLPRGRYRFLLSPDGVKKSAINITGATEGKTKGGNTFSNLGGAGSEIRYSTNCPTETGGLQTEVCYDSTTDSIFVCESAICNSAGWISYSGSATGAPSGANYLVGAADATLTNETVISNLTELNTHLGSSIADGPHTTNAANLTSGIIPSARVGAGHITLISRIDGAVRSGIDATLITGTATSGECGQFDANGDLVGIGTSCANATTHPPKTPICLGYNDADTAIGINDDLHSFFRANAALTISEVWCETDANTITMQIQKDDGAAVNMLTSNLTCNTTGAATSAFVAGENNVADGDKLDWHVLTVPGTTNRVSVCLEYSYD